MKYIGKIEVRSMGWRLIREISDLIEAGEEVEVDCTDAEMLRLLIEVNIGRKVMLKNLVHKRQDFPGRWVLTPG